MSIRDLIIGTVIGTAIGIVAMWIISGWFDRMAEKKAARKAEMARAKKEPSARQR